MVAGDQQLVHTPFVPSGYWSPCAPLIWNPVKAPDIRFSSSHFRKQHPRHKNAVSRTSLSEAIYAWPIILSTTSVFIFAASSRCQVDWLISFCVNMMWKLERIHMCQIIYERLVVNALNTSFYLVPPFPLTDERISFESFVPIYHGLLKEQVEVDQETFIESFRVFDKEDNGLISAAELRHLLTALGEKLRDDEVDVLLSGLENSQGLVPYEAFVQRVMS
ncbi:unnamed protein product [Schistosoma curassoni]|nr:unnamed protein product [Schistosoma curassoni]